MDQRIIEFNKNIRNQKKVPQLKPGDIVRIHKRIKEGEKERIQVFKGIIIAIKGKQSSSPMITVRRESQGVGVEITFPLYSPFIEKIDLLRHSKVRRAKLYYLRERTGKAAKMKVIELSEEEKQKIKEIYQEKKVEQNSSPNSSPKTSQKTETKEKDKK